MASDIVRFGLSNHAAIMPNLLSKPQTHIGRVLRVTFGVALAATFLPGAVPVARAQNSVQTPTKSLFGAPVPTPNGFDNLFDAVEKLVRADRLGTKAERVPDEELLRQMRDNVSRNKPPLASLRLALQKPTIHPPVRDAASDFGNYQGFRALANLLDQESILRMSDRDYPGALQSKLDCIEFGVVITRGGPLRAAIAGRDIENIGRRGLENIVSHLSNEECEAGAARLDRIETLRPLFSDAIREGKLAALAVTRDTFDHKDWEEVVQTTVKLDGTPFSEDERGTLNTIGQAEVLAGIERTFSAALQAGDAPYRVAAPREDFALDPWSTLMAGEVNSPALRTEYEAARAQNRLLAHALRLRIERALHGAYPATLDTSLDPFADPTGAGSRLKYRRVGESYLLYSVGPNLKDDGGTPAPRTETGALTPGAGGDIVAPVFSL